MKMISCLFLFIAVFVQGCYLLPSKPIIEEIRFKNDTEYTIKLFLGKNSTNVNELASGDSITFDIEHCHLLRVKLLSPQKIYNYSFLESELGDPDSTQKCVWGHIHWTYYLVLKTGGALIYKGGKNVKLPIEKDTSIINE